MKRLAIILALFFAASTALATPSDIGLQNTVGGVPLAAPYNNLQAGALMAYRLKPFSTLGQASVSVMRLDMLSPSGGAYGGGVQSAYPVIFVNTDSATQGQQLSMFGYINGRGRGNATFLNSEVRCYGGGDIVSGADAVPECSPVGEFEATTGPKIFHALVNGNLSAGATTIPFKSASNEADAGGRVLLNCDRVYGTGTYQSAAGRTLTFSGTNFTGASQFSSVACGSGNWYIKIGGNQQEYYDPPCAGDDVDPADLGTEFAGTNKCVGHWYQVASCGDATHVTLTNIYDVDHLTNTPGSLYLMCQGVEATAVNTTTHSFTVPTNSVHWADGEGLIQAADHITGWEGINVILHKLYKTGTDTVASNGFRLYNKGPARIDTALALTGETGTGKGGFDNGIVFTDFNGPGFGINFARTTFTGGAFVVGTSNGSTNKTYWGDNGEGSIYYKGGDSTFHLDAATTKVTGAFVTSADAEVTGNLTVDTNQFLTGDMHVGAQTTFGTGVSQDGGGFKHKRVSTGSISASTTSGISFTWDTPFVDTGYQISCTMIDDTGFLTIRGVDATGFSGSGFTVNVNNSDGGSNHSGTLHCIGIHD